MSAPGFPTPPTTVPTTTTTTTTTTIATDEQPWQSLVSAFGFGIVVHAATGAAYVLVRGYGSTLFKDSLRLVLFVFLVTAALWAQLAFIATIINPTPASRSGCQIAVAVASAFDQISRVAVLQYLLWAINSGRKMKLEAFVPQGLLLVRLILGAVLVGMQRPQFGPSCTGTVLILPVAAVTIALDFVLIIAAFFRATRTGLIKEMKEGTPSAATAKGIFWTLLGFAAWTGASVPMVLGLPNIQLILKTVIPAVALTILIGIVSSFSGALVATKPRSRSYPPEAPSPRMETSRDLQSRDLSTSDSDYPPSRYEDVKAGGEIMSVAVFVTPREAPKPNKTGGGGGYIDLMKAAGDGGQAQTMAATAPTLTTGFGGVPVQGQLFPPMKASTAATAAATKTQAPPLREVRKGTSIKKNGKIEISGPILTAGGDQNPLNKIATIDLATAAAAEKERREAAWREMKTQKEVNLQRDSSLIAKRPAPQPPAMSTEESTKRGQSLRRKEVASGGPMENPLKSQAVRPLPVPVPTATTTSAQLSPGVEEIRRRSPRQAPQPFQESQPSPKKETSTQKMRPVRPPRPDGSDAFNAPSPPEPPPPASPIMSAPKTPVQQEDPAAQQQGKPRTSPPQRPPRPESLDIGVEPQVMKAAPKQLLGLNPQVKTLQRKVTPPKKSAKSMAMSPVKEEAPAPAFLLKPLEGMVGATPAATAARQAPPNPPAPTAAGNPRMSAFPLPQRGPSPPRPAPPPPLRELQEDAVEEEEEEEDEKQPAGNRATMLGRNNSVKTTIRPSRQRPPSIEDELVPEIKPVQKRPTAGLPGNPRAMSMLRTGAVNVTASREQTVMFVNNIQYDDPVGVQSIIQGAASKAGYKSAQSPGDAMATDESVLHRPRPIKRKTEPEPSPKTPGHQRNRSGGSVGSRKSNILHSTPGSPTQLPPLPPPPMPPVNPLRPLPNNTKSMTFDEKMAIFFPAPPSGSSTTSGSRGPARRNTPPPQLPPVPAGFLDLDDDKSSRTGKTSERTQSILEVTEIVRDQQPAVGGQARNRSDTDSYAVTDEGGRSWLLGNRNEQSQLSMAGAGPMGGGAGYEGNKRMSSPLLGMPGVAAAADVMSEFSEMRSNTQDDWGSVHSPVQAVNIQVARQVAPKAFNIAGPRDSDGKEVMTIMLDEGASLERSDSNGSNGSIQWHRRIGDDCPTFSDRKERARSRKMVPPTPLLLRTKPGGMNTVVFRPAEPSPVESPTLALEEIQSQLDKLDRPLNEKMGGGRRGNKNADDRDSMDSLKRMTLLQNLEKEMDMQQGHWQEMRGDIRDSLSTIKTSPRRDSILDMTTLRRVPSKENNITGSLASDRRLRKQRSRGESISRESQDEYLGNQAKLVANVNASRAKLNVMSIPKMALGSPTPPDTDESDGDDSLDSRLMMANPRNKKNLRVEKRDSFDGKLWTSKMSPMTELPTPSTGMLWTPGGNNQSSPTMEHPAPPLGLPGTDIGPNRKTILAAKRKSIEDPAQIQSNDLWKKSDGGAKKGRTANGLWKGGLPPAPDAKEPPKEWAQEKEQQSNQKAPRPLTQRPPRRSRRMTLLPDILESPEPLPDNADMLGIFQFPWGERSDTANLNARPGTMFMAMPGTMTTGGPAAVNAALEARSKQLESQEYSSSFFDDYDEEDSVGAGGAGSDEEEDDGFDETTLWEIASLLQTDQVLPSKASLLPSSTRIKFAGESSIVDDYMAELPSDEGEDDSEEEQEEEEHNEDITIQLDTAAFPMPPRQSSLWAGRAGLPLDSNPTPVNGALPQPDEWSWQDYIPSVGRIPRLTARRDTEPAIIESTSLWRSNTIASGEETQASLLWSSDASTAAAMHMWTAPDLTCYAEPRGLFSLSHKRTKADYRATSKQPVAVGMERRQQRVNYERLPVLASRSLWHAERAASTEWNWITMSMGPRSTTDRDHDSATINSTGANDAAWWESRPARSNSRRGRKGAMSPNAAAPAPMRQKYSRRSSVAYHADWDAALAEAVALSYPARRLLRHATKEDWTAALNTALMQRERNNVRKYHPAFAGSIPLEPMMSFHPALTGYIRPAVPSVPLVVGETLARIPIRSSSDAGPRSVARASRGRKEILAQIQAIEAEAGATLPPRVPLVPVVPDNNTAGERLAAGKQSSRPGAPQLTRSNTVPNRPAPFLWAKPLDASAYATVKKAATGTATTSMWAPPARKNSLPRASPGEMIHGEDPGLRRKRSKKDAKRAEMMTRNGGGAGVSPEMRSDDFNGQAMWRPSLKTEQKQKDWLDDSVNKRFKGIQFRY